MTVPGGGFRVSPEQLHSLAIALVQAAGDARADQRTLRDRLDPLFGPEWSGAAAERFAVLWQHVERHHVAMTEALEGIGRVLGSAAQAYAGNEADIARLFR